MVEIFFFNQFKELCKENEIIKQMTTTYTLEQHKVAKWKKLTLVENAQCIINFVNLPNSFLIDGYNDIVKAYELYNIFSKTIIINNDVIFMKTLHYIT